MTKDEAIDTFADLAFPYTTEKFASIEASGFKMAHYTTAENAMLILGGEKLWLRNAGLMNDFSEVAYGSDLLERSLDSGLGLRLQIALSGVHPGLYEDIARWLKNLDSHTREHTYVASLSEHDPVNILGKLSMWRAYGGPTSGVAIIFNTEAFRNESDRLGAYSSPVMYGGFNEFSAELLRVVENMEQNQELLRKVPFQSARSIMFNAFQFSALSIKHPGFEEEREWRIIHSPLTESSAYINTEIHTVRGVPQMICPILLKDQPGLDMPWLNMDKLLYRIIIGPCVYPKQVAWAFKEVLKKLDVSNPESRILTADIPLRQRG